MNYRNIKDMQGLLYKPCVSYWALAASSTALKMIDLKKIEMYYIQLRLQ